MGRLDLPDKRRDEDEYHPEDFEQSRVRKLDQGQRDLLKQVMERHGIPERTPEPERPRTHRRPAAIEIPTTVPSKREMQVVQLIAQGYTNLEAAEILVLSEETVKSHVRHVLDKLGARSRAHAVAIAYDRGLLKPGSLV